MAAEEDTCSRCAAGAGTCTRCGPPTDEAEPLAPATASASASAPEPALEETEGEVFRVAAEEEEVEEVPVPTATLEANVKVLGTLEQWDKLWVSKHGDLSRHVYWFGQGLRRYMSSQNRENTLSMMNLSVDHVITSISDLCQDARRSPDDAQRMDHLKDDLRSAEHGLEKLRDTYREFDSTNTHIHIDGVLTKIRDFRSRVSAGLYDPRTYATVAATATAAASTHSGAVEPPAAAPSNAVQRTARWRRRHALAAVVTTSSGGNESDTDDSASDEPAPAATAAVAPTEVPVEEGGTRTAPHLRFGPISTGTGWKKQPWERR